MAIYFWVATIWILLAVPVWLFIRGCSKTQYMTDEEIIKEMERTKC